MARILRMNVVHNGKSLAKGDKCPEGLLELFEKEGLLEAGPVEAEPKAVEEASDSQPKVEEKSKEVKKGKSAK